MASHFNNSLFCSAEFTFHACAKKIMNTQLYWWSYINQQEDNLPLKPGDAEINKEVRGMWCDLEDYKFSSLWLLRVSLSK